MSSAAGEVIALLQSVDANDRALAWNFLEFRDDFPDIVAAVRQNPPVFEPSAFAKLESLTADWVDLKKWLANTPDWAIDWRVAVARRMTGPLTGYSLKHLATINARKARGIERPFNDDLLQFVAIGI